MAVAVDGQVQLVLPSWSDAAASLSSLNISNPQPPFDSAVASLAAKSLSFGDPVFTSELMKAPHCTPVACMLCACMATQQAVQSLTCTETATQAYLLCQLWAQQLGWCHWGCCQQH
jgi:hypothetical protein